MKEGPKAAKGIRGLRHWSQLKQQILSEHVRERLHIVNRWRGLTMKSRVSLGVFLPTLAFPLWEPVNICLHRRRMWRLQHAERTWGWHEGAENKKHKKREDLLALPTPVLLPSSRSPRSPPLSLPERKRWRRSRGWRLRVKLTDLTLLLFIRQRAAFGSSLTSRQQGLAARCFSHAPYRQHLFLASCW